jgi:hypothetical protein
MNEDSTFKPSIALISSLRTQSCGFHDSVDTVLTTRLYELLCAQRYGSIPIGKAALNQELFDLPHKALLLVRYGAFRLL